MELMEAILTRKSIRAFKSDPVPKETLIRILNAAIWAPSGGNAQNWEFIVLTGEDKIHLDEKLLELLKSDNLLPAEAPPGKPSGVVIEAIRKLRLLINRQKISAALFRVGNRLKTSSEKPSDIATQTIQKRRLSNRERISTLLSEMGISYEKFIFEGSATFFGAPVAIIVTMDQATGIDPILSIGASIQNLLLAARSLELGTCWICMILRYEKKIKELLRIPKNKKIVSGIALGFPDPELSINKYKSSRGDLSEFARWIGFD